MRQAPRRSSARRAHGGIGGCSARSAAGAWPSGIRCTAFSTDRGCFGWDNIGPPHHRRSPAPARRRSRSGSAPPPPTCSPPGGRRGPGRRRPALEPTRRRRRCWFRASAISEYLTHQAAILRHDDAETVRIEHLRQSHHGDFDCPLGSTRSPFAQTKALQLGWERQPRDSRHVGGGRWPD